MRVVLQRVSRASVSIAGSAVGSIRRGYLVLVGFTTEDTEHTEERLRWMVEKIIGLRLFADADGKMTPEGAQRPRKSSFNVALDDVDGGVLVVSQFTLYGDTSRGRRPSFVDAAPPEIAIPLYERFVALLRERLPGRVETGEFGAMMAVELVNDGPVTLVLER